MSWARGLMAQIEVVHAVALRETRTRFGAHQLGYVWALVEPALMILTFVLLFRFGDRPPPHEGMDIFGFIATGVIPYTLFSNATNRVAEAINGNKGLLFYPHVQPLDLVFARGLLEFATYVAVFVLIMGGHALWIQQLDISSSLLVLQGLTLAALLGASLGMVFCGLAQFSNVVERARGPLLRPFFWISGIFFTADQLPEHARELALYNPVLHCNELVRAGWYPGYEDTYADPAYTAFCILVVALLGMSIERVVRRRIEVT